MRSYTFSRDKLRPLAEKLFKWFLSFVLLLVSLQAYSQNDKRVTMGEEVNTIGLAFKAIEKQTGYRISYDSKLNVSKRITLPSTPMSLNSIFPLILKGTGYSYTIVNELIGIRYNNKTNTQTAPILTSKPKPKPKPSVVQYGSITGRVVDSKTNLPVSGALITIERLGDINLTTDSSGIFIAERLQSGQYDIIVTYSEYNTSFERINLSVTNLQEQTEIKLIRKFVPSVPNSQTVSVMLPIDDFKLSHTIVRYTPNAFALNNNPKVGLKTNLISAATTSLNLAVEVRLSDKLTLDIPVSYNPWKFKDNKLFRHLLIQPELRYWTCESFNGHFFGANLMYSFVNMGNIKMPFGLWSGLKDYRFEGNVFGVGVSYGYQWILSKRFSMEATVGVGYAYANYDKYPCVECGKLIGRESKHYFGPTKLGLSLIYFIK